MGTLSQLAPTAVEDDEIVFRLSDTEHEYTDVKVWSDVELAPDGQSELGMAEVEGGWELRLALPDLDCLEYLFDVDGTLAPIPATRTGSRVPSGRTRGSRCPATSPRPGSRSPSRPDSVTG